MSGQNTVNNFHVRRDKVANNVTSTDTIKTNSLKMSRDVQVLTANTIVNNISNLYTCFSNDIVLIINFGTISSEIFIVIQNPLYTENTSANIEPLSIESPIPTTKVFQNGSLQLTIPSQSPPVETYTYLIRFT